MQYDIVLTAQFNVEAHIHVEAASKEEAEQKAIDTAREGNAEWLYNGVDDESIEVSE